MTWRYRRTRENVTKERRKCRKEVGSAEFFREFFNGEIFVGGSFRDGIWDGVVGQVQVGRRTCMRLCDVDVTLGHIKLNLFIFNLIIVFSFIFVRRLDLACFNQTL